jgi:hypothetical protein
MMSIYIEINYGLRERRYEGGGGEHEERLFRVTHLALGLHPKHSGYDEYI